METTPFNALHLEWRRLRAAISSSNRLGRRALYNGNVSRTESTLHRCRMRWVACMKLGRSDVRKAAGQAYLRACRDGLHEILSTRTWSSYRGLNRGFFAQQHILQPTSPVLEGLGGKFPQVGDRVGALLIQYRRSLIQQANRHYLRVNNRLNSQPPLFKRAARWSRWRSQSINLRMHRNITNNILFSSRPYQQRRRYLYKYKKPHLFIKNNPNSRRFIIKKARFCQARSVKKSSRHHQLQQKFAYKQRHLVCSLSAVERRLTHFVHNLLHRTRQAPVPQRPRSLMPRLGYIRAHRGQLIYQRRWHTNHHIPSFRLRTKFPNIGRKMARAELARLRTQYGSSHYAFRNRGKLSGRYSLSCSTFHLAEDPEFPIHGYGLGRAWKGRYYRRGWKGRVRNFWISPGLEEAVLATSSASRRKILWRPEPSVVQPSHWAVSRQRWRFSNKLKHRRLMEELEHRWEPIGDQTSRHRPPADAWPIVPRRFRFSPRWVTGFRRRRHFRFSRLELREAGWLQGLSAHRMLYRYRRSYRWTPQLRRAPGRKLNQIFQRYRRILTQHYSRKRPRAARKMAYQGRYLSVRYYSGYYDLRHRHQLRNLFEDQSQPPHYSTEYEHRFRNVENRLDLILLHLNFVPTIFGARELVRLQAVRINGVYPKSPSYRISPNSIIHIQPEPIHRLRAYFQSRRFGRRIHHNFDYQRKIYTVFYRGPARREDILTGDWLSYYRSRDLRFDLLR